MQPEPEQIKKNFNRAPLVIAVRVVLLLALLALLSPLLLAVSQLGDRRPILPGAPLLRIEPRPTPIEPVLGEIALFQAHATGFTIAGIHNPDDPTDKWVYDNHFSQKDTARIFLGLLLEYPQVDKAYSYQTDFKIYRDGAIFWAGTADSTAPEGSDWSYTFVNFGWDEPGHWTFGNYAVEVFYQDELIGNAVFTVHE